MKVKPHPKFKEIFLIDGKLATINLVSGERVYGEDLIQIGNVEYRIWDYTRSKPAAAIIKKLETFPLSRGMSILYLGIAASTTASHFSDIVGKEGVIYGVEISERSLRETIPVAEQRGNIVCILADSRKPELYENTVLDKVDCVYEDIADPDQIKILIRNCEKFLKRNGCAIITVKSQSIDSVKPPKEVYRECLKELEKHFEILDSVELDPYQKNHLFVVMKFK